MQRTRPRLLHGALINRYDFIGRPGGPLGDKGIGHLRGFDLVRHGTGHPRRFNPARHGTGHPRRFNPARHGTGHPRRFNPARHSTGHPRRITRSFSSHRIGNGRAVTGTLIGTPARN
ncbi:hypothetical protein [Streptomyces sp. NPDC059753]|uniref:hypothetical protein n=1 Tax=Streptomyces sp. NPDC059753 TaxID=3346933 RepID=UPI003647CE9E